MAVQLLRAEGEAGGGVWMSLASVSWGIPSDRDRGETQRPATLGSMCQHRKVLWTLVQQVCDSSAAARMRGSVTASIGMLSKL